MRRAQTQTFSVPTADLRAGDFSSVTTPICDPLTRTVAGTCTAFSGNRIPANRLDPVALALLDKVPLPTSGGTVQNLLAVDDQVNPMNQFSLKVDHRLGMNDTLYARVTSYRVDDTQPFGTTSLNEALVPGFGRTVTTHSENVAVGHTHAFSTRWLNEVRFGYLRARGGQVSPNQGVDFAERSGLQGVTGNPADMGYPQVSFGGLFSTIGDPTSFVSRDDRSYEVYDNVMYESGSHRIKFGGYLFHLDVQSGQSGECQGELHVQRSMVGQCACRLPAGISEQFPGRHRPRRRARTQHLVSCIRAGRLAGQLEPDAELRIAVRDQQPDGRCRQSVVGHRHPRQTLRHCERRRRAASRRQRHRSCPRFRFPYVSSKDAGWTRGLLRPSYRRFAPRTGHGVGDRRRPPDDRQCRLRCLPQPVGVQRPAGARADAAVLLCQDSHRCGRCGSADATDADGAARLRRTGRSEATR